MACASLIVLLFTCICCSLNLAYICTINDVPIETLLNGIFFQLSPPSLTRLGLTCKTYSDLAKISFLHNYATVRSGKVCWDVEKIYDLFHEEMLLISTFEHMNPKDDETNDLKRLVLFSLPVYQGLKHRDLYSKYHTALFSKALIEGNIRLTNKFPELCRMVLKHSAWKKLDPLTVSVLRPEWIERALPKVASFSYRNFDQIAVMYHPAVIFKLAEGLIDPPEELKRIIVNKHFDGELQNIDKFGPVEMFIVAIMTTDDNLDEARKMFTEFPRKSEFVPFLYNIVMHAHEGLLVFLLSIIQLSELGKRLIVLYLVKYNKSFAVYEALRGETVFQKCRSYLNSYDLESGEFRARRPTKPSLRMILEAAIVFNCPEAALIRLIRMKRSRTDEGLLMLAMTKAVSNTVIYTLLENFDPEKVKLSVLFDITILLHIRKNLRLPISHFVAESFSYSEKNVLNCQFLWELSTRETFVLALTDEKLSSSEYKQPYLISRLIERLVSLPNGMEQVRELVKKCYFQSIHFKTTLDSYPDSLIPECFDFLDEMPLHEIVLKLPKEVPTTICFFMKNTVSLLISHILRRDGGYEAISDYFTHPGTLCFFLMHLKHERLSLEKIFLNLKGTPNWKTYLDGMMNGGEHKIIIAKFFDEMIRLFDYPDVSFLIGEVITHFLQNATDLDQVPLLKRLSVKNLAEVIEANVALAVDADEYQFFGTYLTQCGLINLVLKILVLNHNVTTHNNLGNMYPNILVLLSPNDATSVDAQIQNILLNQDNL